MRVYYEQESSIRPPIAMDDGSEQGCQRFHRAGIFTEIKRDDWDGKVVDGHINLICRANAWRWFAMLRSRSGITGGIPLNSIALHGLHRQIPSHDVQAACRTECRHTVTPTAGEDHIVRFAIKGGQPCKLGSGLSFIISGEMHLPLAFTVGCRRAPPPCNRGQEAADIAMAATVATMMPVKYAH